MSIVAAPPAATERWLHAMGSNVHVLAFDDPLELGDLADQLEALEQCWSRFRDDSDLAQLNSSAATRVEVAPMLAAALHRARLAWTLTDGAFDPTVHDPLCAAGYAEPFPTHPTPRGDLSMCRPAPGMGDVHVDVERCVVERPVGVRFDLGGIGKGLAADLVATRLVERGATGACVSMGGDVRVAGVAPEGAWIVPVEHPHRATRDRLGATWFDAPLRHGAIVTSTRLFRRWTTTRGEPAHHLVEPVSGRPVHSGVDAVVVAADEAWWAEVLAKAALVVGATRGASLLERHGVTGWIVETAPAMESVES